MTEERIEGPLDGGADYAIVYYQDDKGEPAEKDVAVRAEIVEFDAADEVISRTYGELK